MEYFKLYDFLYYKSSQDDLIIDEEAVDIQSGGHPHTPDDSSDSELKMEMFPLEDINYNWLDIGDEFNKCCECKCQ